MQGCVWPGGRKNSGNSLAVSGVHTNVNDRMEGCGWWGGLSFGLLSSVVFSSEIEAEGFQIAADSRR